MILLTSACFEIVNLCIDNSENWYPLKNQWSYHPARGWNEGFTSITASQQAWPRCYRAIVPGNIMGGGGWSIYTVFSAQIRFLWNLREFDLCDLEIGFNAEIEHFKWEFLVILWGVCLYMLSLNNVFRAQIRFFFAILREFDLYFDLCDVKIMVNV